MVEGISARREHREWVAKSLIYLYVTDAGSGSWGWARTCIASCLFLTP